jgi:hypothetical protein
VVLTVAPSLLTFRANLSFIPVPETLYFAQFAATNGAGLTTLSQTEIGLLYTETPPATRANRFGHGDQVGVHRSFDNDPRAAAYTLDSTFYNLIADQRHGTVQLITCPRNQSLGCIVVDALDFAGEKAGG